MALGEGGCEFSRPLVRLGATLASASIAAELPAACVLSGLLESLWYGVGMGDLVTFSATTVLLLVPAPADRWIPARQASPGWRLQR
jgi:hypothetical protein